MEYAELTNDFVDQDEYHAIITKDYDWKQQNLLFNNEQIEQMKNGWLQRQKDKEDNTISNACPFVSPEQLNRMQRFAYNIVQEFRNNNKPLYMIINGGAGSGKTFAINAICTSLANEVKRAAPTAKAAFLINGETLHSLLHIPVNPPHKIEKLGGQILQQLQYLFQYVKFIIIDEYSMLSQTMLSKIDLRLKQIKQKNSEYFGGISIILTGDPGQLPAVCAPSLYSKVLKNDLDTNGAEAYKLFRTVVKFNEVMRQQLDDNPKQAQFIDMLPRFRNGDATISDWKLLCERVPTPLNEEKFKNAPRIYPENIPCNQYNIQRLSNLNQPIAPLNAYNEPPSSRKYDSDQMSGLSNLLYLSPESFVVFSTNIWKKYGLVNGANATIKAILYPDDKEPTNTLPHTIVIHCAQYTGPQFFTDFEKQNWIPINLHTFFNPILKCSRTQMPFRLAYAITVHKSQGQTMDIGVIDFTEKEQQLGSSYVQLTRFKHIDNILIKPFPYSRITTSIKNSSCLKPRQEEEERLKQLTDETLVKFSHLLPQ